MNGGALERSKEPSEIARAPVEVLLRVAHAPAGVLAEEDARTLARFCCKLVPEGLGAEQIGDPEGRLLGEGGPGMEFADGDSGVGKSPFGEQFAHESFEVGLPEPGESLGDPSGERFVQRDGLSVNVDAVVIQGSVKSVKGVHRGACLLAVFERERQT